ncbi:hypothetical protein D3C73_1558420 [compost metagenome]
MRCEFNTFLDLNAFFINRNAGDLKMVQRVFKNGCCATICRVFNPDRVMVGK